MDNQISGVPKYKLEIPKKSFWYSLLLVPVGYFIFIIAKYFLIGNLVKIFQVDDFIFPENISLIATPVMVSLIIFFIVLNIIKKKNLKDLKEDGFVSFYIKANIRFLISGLILVFFLGIILSLLDFLIHNGFVTPSSDLDLENFISLFFGMGFSFGLFIGIFFGLIGGVASEFKKDS
jgi:hypothetical protein